MARRSLWILLLLVGCTKSSISNSPYSYAPTSPNAQWTPSASYRVPDFIDKVFDMPDVDGKASLIDLVDIALRQNPDTATTWAKARESAADYAISMSDYYPMINFEADVTKLHGTLSGSSGSSGGSSSAGATQTS